MQNHKNTGILLINLGTPDAPEPAALRRYLAEFLSDPRVVDRNPWLWKLVLHGVILRIRPRRSAHAYKKVWLANGSPLLVHSQKLVADLAEALKSSTKDAPHLSLGMRYGTPSIKQALAELQQAGLSRLIVLPLYPQYSASTTATSFDAIARVFKDWRQLPELHFIESYYDQPAYIEALAASVRNDWQANDETERLMISFHGLPERFIAAGDPYREQCEITGKLLRVALGLDEQQCQIAYQSRFGPEAWIKPYADKTLQQWAREGIKSVSIIAPGFSVDCLETLEELAMQNRDLFLDAGGESYRYIPALNDSRAHVDVLAEILRPYLGYN